MFHYGYFVLLPDGRLVAAGSDWGRTPNTYKAGDSMGVKNDRQGIVVGVVKGEPAKRFNVDVMVIVDQQLVEERNQLSIEFVSAAMEAITAPPRNPGPPTIQIPWKDGNARAVAIWNRMILRPPTETFHEFLVEVPLKWSFGEEWYKTEMAKPEANRHVIIRWLAGYREQGQKHRPAGSPEGPSLRGASNWGDHRVDRART